jgi:hypothetical protein
MMRGWHPPANVPGAFAGHVRRLPLFSEDDLFRESTEQMQLGDLSASTFPGDAASLLDDGR